MAGGKAWSLEEQAALQDALTKGMSYVLIQASLLPCRTVRAIQQQVYCRGTMYMQRKRPGWRYSELRKLGRVLEDPEVESWSDVASYFPRRTSLSCRHAANRHLVPPRLYLPVGSRKKDGKCKKVSTKPVKRRKKTEDASGFDKTAMKRVNFGNTMSVRSADRVGGSHA